VKIVELKLYLKPAQESILRDWLRSCCWIYNQALEQRIKRWQRRQESTSYYDQCLQLTAWRKKIAGVSLVPAQFQRGSLTRVDLGMKAFFRRVKSGEKPGFPRFKSRHRWNSMEYLAKGNFLRSGYVSIPCLGLVKARGRILEGEQRGLRIIQRASGWYAQIIVNTEKPAALPITGKSVGVDVGLNSLIALSTGETVTNPRWANASAFKLRHAQRVLARRQKGSANRGKARNKLAQVQERIAAQRRSFCHALSTRLVREHDLIAFEKLNIKGLARGRFACSMMDAAWGTLQIQTLAKAEYAGRTVVFVDPCGTSRECPQCGRVQAKNLSERRHQCPCGCDLDRDVAAAQIILSRAPGLAGANACGGNASPVMASAVAGGPDETGRAK
jgi:putative transposase